MIYRLPEVKNWRGNNISKNSHHLYYLKILCRWRKGSFLGEREELPRNTPVSIYDLWFGSYLVFCLHNIPSLTRIPDFASTADYDRFILTAVPNVAQSRGQNSSVRSTMDDLPLPCNPRSGTISEQNVLWQPRLYTGSSSSRAPKSNRRETVLIKRTGKPHSHLLRYRRFSRHRRLVAMASPGIVAYIIWWSFAIVNPVILRSFTEVTGEEETPNWYMCVTMAFGSMLAGATSEVSTVGRQVCDDLRAVKGGKLCEIPTTRFSLSLAKYTCDNN